MSITATELKSNLGKYLLLAATEDIFITRNGKVVAKSGHGKFVGREPGMAVNKALSTWKEITAPRKVERSGIPASGV